MKKCLEAKQSKNTLYWFRFGWKWKIRSKKKQNEVKKLFFFREPAKRMPNGSRFALKRKNFICETGASYSVRIQNVAGAAPFSS